MKVSRLTRHLVDIGPLDYVLKLPMKGRTSLSMKSICDKCRKHITDEFFIAGFKKGYKNMIFHKACCDEETLRNLE